MIRPPAPAAPTAITVRCVDADCLIVVLTASGRWDPAMRHQSVTVLRECLAGRPEGLIIDLTGLDDRAALSVPIWAEARHLGSAILPPVPVVYCVTPHTGLAQALVPVHPTVGQAHAALLGE
ncbi:hypothetical protein [Actinoplanes sp. NPDC051494]|uniref:hypothetical protein n=1 Tax=Actinoplanes sp. NPDC051494 TaxID=3363907 RepID=UPI0037ADAF6F